MTPTRRRLRHARLWLQGIIATLVIVSAVFVGVMQLVVLPWLSQHPERVGAFLGERLHRPVTIDQVEARWERTGPLLDLRRVRIGVDQPGQPALLITHAGLKIDLFAWAYRNAHWNEFRLDGFELSLLHDVDGRWQLSGLSDGGSGNRDDQGALLDLGALVLRDLTLNLNDAGSGRQFRFAADELRLINDGDRHRLAARVRCLQTESAPIDTVVEYDSASDSGTVYVGGSSLDLGAILHGYPVFGMAIVHGKGRAQLWGNWHADYLTDARLEVGLTDVLLEAQTPIELDDKRRLVPRVNFNEIAFGARWSRTEQGWTGDIADLVLERQEIALPPAFAHFERQLGADGAPTYRVRLRDVDIAAPATLAMLAENLPSRSRRWLYAANPEGNVHSADLRWTSAEDFDLAAGVDGLGWNAVDMLPGATGLRGSVTGDAQALVLELPAHNALAVEELRVFRRPFEFSEFAGTIAAYRIDGAWRVETPALAFEGEGYGGELRGSLDLPDDGSRPSIDVYAVVRHALVPASHLFWPINVMPPAAVAWLDRALEGGRVTAGRAVIHGDLADWPFRNFSGRFEARADVEDVTLKYLPDWPAAEHVRAQADFVNTSLRVDADSGIVHGNRFTHANADIVELGEPVLELDLDAQGAGHDLLAFLKATPIGQRFGTQLLGVDVGGQGKVDFHLHVPIKQTDQLALTGIAALSDAELSDAKYALRLNHANGKVRFSQSGFSADDLAVTMHDQPATFGLAVGAFTANAKHVVEANLAANLTAGQVLAHAPALMPYADYFTGRSNWNASFNAEAAENGGQQLLVTSDLRGIASELPAPLNKSADAALPMRLVLGMPIVGGSIDLRLNDLLHLRGRLASPASPFAARVAFGGDSEEAPPKSGFVISGKAAALDLSGWLDFATSGTLDGGDAGGSGTDGDLLRSVDLQADSMAAYGRDFGAAKFTLSRAADGLDLGFNGSLLDGTLHLPLANLRQHGVTAQFARLYWPELPESEADANQVSSENPASVPPLHIHVNDFRLGEQAFGEASVETYPVAGGAHFEQVSAHSQNIEIRGRGDWTGRPGSDHSTFSIEFSAHDIGHMLDGFGYPGVIVGGPTVAHIDGSWSGAPSTFSLARLDGTLKIAMKAGRIPEANPGGARVLGLFNLAAIPRRLAFDWGDLFKTGFSFDSIEGQFALKDGVAHTDKLEVRSPTADMVLKGSMGLKSKDWDQTVDVTPHVGGTLAIGGALLGGPVGAAAGVLLQGVLHNQINQVARAQYKVTGSWDNPKVTVVAREARKPPPKPPVKEGSETPPAPVGTDPKRGTG